MCSAGCPEALLFEGLIANLFSFLFFQKRSSQSYLVKDALVQPAKHFQGAQVNHLHPIYLPNAAHVCRRWFWGRTRQLTPPAALPHVPAVGSNVPLPISSPGKGTQEH